jgi:hypothetical protein
MKKREEQLAQELDAFLTARLHNRPVPPLSDEVAVESRLADTLLQTAARCEVDPLFLSSLEARLESAASSAKLSKKRSERPPFRHNLIDTLKEGFTMKRMTFALGALMALLVIGYAAWFMWPGGQEPQIVAEQPLLRPLPGLSGAPGMGGGRGGDGSDTAPQIATDAVHLESDLRLWNPLAEATYHLAATLPTSPADMPVYEQAGGGHFSQEDATRFAALFGFSGSGYQETYPVDDPDWKPPAVYTFFDGTRQLSVSEAHFYYYDRALSPMSETDTLPFAQAVSVAEAFLRDKGLLDFSYETMSPYGNEVEFRRVLNGHTVIFPEFQVSVHSSGQVWSASHTPLTWLAAVGNYPLRTVEEAWQTVISDGIDYRRSFFSLYPGPNYVPPQPMGDRMELDAMYRYWDRTFRDGQSVSLYTYATVFLPLSENDAPRIQVDRYLLEAPATELWAMAQELGKQWYVEGIYRERPGGAVLELVEWQVVENVDYTFREGTVSREGGRTFLVSDEGERLLIVDAPADLPDGKRIYIHGWFSSAAEGSGQSFNWSGMGLVVEQDAIMDEPVFDEPFEPYRISQVTIHEVAILYTVGHIFDGANDLPRYVVQPVWRFKGETDTNEIIEIYVQAVTDEFIQEQPVDGPVQLDGPVDYP